MLRVLLESRGDLVELPDGETTIGRDTGCRIRFNDGTVSRVHASIRVEPNTAIVEDRGSSNGTLLNGTRLRGPRRLKDGDVLQLGDRTVRVRVRDRDDQPADLDVDVITSERFEPPAGALIPPGPITPTRPSVVPPRLDVRNCVGCRMQLGARDERCSRCGRAQGLPRFVAVTTQHRLPEAARRSLENSGAERRRELRRSVQIPVVFQSEALTFEAVARDVSGSGLFVETDLLEPVGTLCRVTILADSAPAISLAAIVSRVVERADGEAPAAGLGLGLLDMDPESELWLRRLIGRLDADVMEAV